jgi:hypothetical protein
MLQWLNALREDAAALAQDADSLTEDAAAESGITIEQVNDRFNFTSAHFPQFFCSFVVIGWILQGGQHSFFCFVVWFEQLHSVGVFMSSIQ